MKPIERNTNHYLDTLLTYYEEEVMGEAYLYGLGENFQNTDERNKLDLLAQVERIAAETLRPLLDKYGLIPRDNALLKTLGEADVESHRHFTWNEFMEYIVVRYPAYTRAFRALERIAPKEDLPTLKRLTDHEVATIDFARSEINGDPNSVAPLRQYLNGCV